MAATDVISVMSKIIELMYRYRLELPLRDLAEQCGAEEEDVLPVLSKLVGRGWLRYDEKSKLYRHGLSLLAYTGEDRLRKELIHQCDHIMRKLSEECNQTVILNVLDGLHAICIHKIEPEKAVRIASRVGRESPLHAGCSGRILLAYAPEAVRKAVLAMPLIKYTPFTITSPEALNESLFEIRRAGYCSSVEEIDPGAGAISYAILDGSNNLIAGLSVIGTRFAYENEGLFWKAMLDKAVKEIRLVMVG